MMSVHDWIDRTHLGDCRDLLRQMYRDGVQVQTCVTSPPYFRLRSYLPDDHPDKAREIGREASPDAYVAHLVDVFRAVRDVLTDDGTLWIVIGDTYAARRSWQAPSTKGGPKHASAQGATGGMSLDGIKPKDLIGIPWRLAFALRDDGWFLRQDKRDVWTIAPQRFTGNHFAVFPEALVTPCILAGSRIGDGVLDPFMGSGTTAMVAARLERRFIGCELNPAYLSLFSTRGVAS